VPPSCACSAAMRPLHTDDALLLGLLSALALALLDEGSLLVALPPASRTQGKGARKTRAGTGASRAIGKASQVGNAHTAPPTRQKQGMQEARSWKT